MIHIISTGPGDIDALSIEAKMAIDACQVLVGYKKYLTLIEPLIQDKECYYNGMKQEVKRCERALELAREGLEVGLVSGGDAGVYGMAGLMLELMDEDRDISVKVYPGITAACAAAARLGAPLTHDHVMISLSDLLTDIELIKKRIHAAGMGDFVTCIYNPKSKGRPHYIEEARDILLQYKAADTVVGVVNNAYREGEQVHLRRLDDFCDVPIDMSTIVIVGNRNTYIQNDRMITPRGYNV